MFKNFAPAALLAGAGRFAAIIIIIILLWKPIIIIILLWKSIIIIICIVKIAIIITLLPWPAPTCWPAGRLAGVVLLAVFDAASAMQQFEPRV